MKKLLLLSIFILFASTAHATPSGLSLSGTPAQDADLTISGSNLFDGASGSKGTVAPRLWDNFEDGSDGALLSSSPGSVTWTKYSTGNTSGHYDDTQAYSGTLSAYNHIDDAEGWESEWDTSYTTFTNCPDGIYVSYRYRWDWDGNGSVNEVAKLSRISTTDRTDAGGYSGPGTYKIEDNFANPGQYRYDYLPGDRTVEEYMGSGYIRENTWTRVQVTIKEGTPNTADGSIYSVNDNYSELNDPFQTTDTNYDFDWNGVWLGLVVANVDAPTLLDLYIDDIYADEVESGNSRAPIVEIGNASTYSGSSIKILQIPQIVWSDTSIGISCQATTFDANDSAWLYVTDVDGNTSTGLAITFGAGAPTPTITGQDGGLLDDLDTIAVTGVNLSIDGVLMIHDSNTRGAGDLTVNQTIDSGNTTTLNATVAQGGFADGVTSYMFHQDTLGTWSEGFQVQWDTTVVDNPIPIAVTATIGTGTLSIGTGSISYTDQD